ncbi:hypothetical protein ACFYMI_36660 [Streptomyces collinus]|uniref:hypothetical protein n=1 Tax=Streptomyces collinus TaxID=42684 RepID=UPI00369D4925
MFVLREVFDFSYSEIAAPIGKFEEAVGQLNQRARNRVYGRGLLPGESPADATFGPSCRSHVAQVVETVQGCLRQSSAGMKSQVRSS